MDRRDPDYTLLGRERETAEEDKVGEERDKIFGAVRRCAVCWD